ncbi:MULTISPECIES: ImmA/IrrE family metallo-endopeptidase [Enterococcus]|uniref:ImmA/IrrE family metallo-endopeptidase n=1 Tax=Enterococcus raffinosus TaxID=71452 RepID=A0AAW8TGB3_9ENTE|nr:ImmA/IrrE family metallo-endopeptidase [Enterococcus raffinosus]MDT2528572.1 ImmA/IrrE family metallo-endopeptidase [Enterococcus raffinosus]MDT2545790.1 ImmA/IrrE family metallo-endopeptidase [Enterococcus raffinosus]MDT2579044.1 ImmA/IrrE family metallo-endopeptidase [Enterococcus raffinosus]
MCEVNGHLLKLVKSLGLELLFVNMERSGIYFSEEKAIFLSNNLLDENSDFEISHELGHCIEKHEELSAYYNATDYSRRKLEFEANRIAIEILLFIWSNEYDFDKEQLNAVRFMEYYNIPWSLESCVRDTMQNYG